MSLYLQSCCGNTITTSGEDIGVLSHPERLLLRKKPHWNYRAKVVFCFLFWLCYALHKREKRTGSNIDFNFPVYVVLLIGMFNSCLIVLCHNILSESSLNVTLNMVPTTMSPFITGAAP